MRLAGHALSRGQERPISSKKTCGSTTRSARLEPREFDPLSPSYYHYPAELSTVCTKTRPASAGACAERAGRTRGHRPRAAMPAGRMTPPSVQAGERTRAWAGVLLHIHVPISPRLAPAARPAPATTCCWLCRARALPSGCNTRRATASGDLKANHDVDGWPVGCRPPSRASRGSSLHSLEIGRSRCRSLTLRAKGRYTGICSSTRGRLGQGC